MIDLAELKTYLRVDGDADDDILTQLEAAAVAFAEKQTARYFGAPAEVTEYVQGNGTSSLWVTEAPNGGTVAVASSLYPGGTETAIDPAGDDGFVVRGRRLLRKGGYVWDCGTEYALTYTRGYDAGAEDPDLRLAVLQLCEFVYKRRGTAGLKSEVIGGYSYTLADFVSGLDALPMVRLTLDAFRRVRF